MNILDAIKSGKRFRLIDDPHTEWIEINTLGRFHINGHCIVLTKEKIICDDWEIEEKKLELSWEQIHRAVSLNTNHCATVGMLIHDFDKMKKELGFE